MYPALEKYPGVPVTTAAETDGKVRSVEPQTDPPDRGGEWRPMASGRRHGDRWRLANVILPMASGRRHGDRWRLGCRYGDRWRLADVIGPMASGRRHGDRWRLADVTGTDGVWLTSRGPMASGCRLGTDGVPCDISPCDLAEQRVCTVL